MGVRRGATFGLPLPVSGLLSVPSQLSGFDVTAMSTRRLPRPGQLSKAPAVSRDSTPTASFYAYARETADDANIAGVMTFDEARRLAVNVGSCSSCLEQTNERPQRPSQSAKV
jgi:hypothetical protein